MIHDIGAAAENIIIYVTGEGIGTCWLEAINRTAIAEILSLPEHLKVCSAVALGYPAMSSHEVAPARLGRHTLLLGRRRGPVRPQAFDEGCYAGQVT